MLANESAQMVNPEGYMEIDVTIYVSSTCFNKLENETGAMQSKTVLLSLSIHCIR